MPSSILPILKPFDWQYLHDRQRASTKLVYLGTIHPTFSYQAWLDLAKGFDPIPYQ
jgi:hypothetical protein